MHISFTKRKIHTLYVALAVISLLLAGASHVRAHDESYEHTDHELTATLAQAKNVQKVNLSQEQQDRFINLIRNTFARMDAAIDRLENVSTRIETRVAALEAEGVDTSLARAPLADAVNKLAEARAQLSQAQAQAEVGIVSDTPRERFMVAREQFKNIKQTIRDAYVLLREALAELKDAVMEAELNKKGASPAVTDTTVNQEPVTQ